MTQNTITITALSKSYPGQQTPALKKLSTTLESGKITGLVGPDGAGKTTLLRLMTGLLQPTDGNIVIYGYNTRTHAAYIQDILGYMPQKFGLYEDLTVQENLTLYAHLKSLSPEETPAIFERLLQFTTLKDFTHRLAGQLSGGMKQKLGLACALMGSPKLLLLDEPSVGVDPISRRELWAMVREIATQDIVVVWSTSYLDEAEKCDHTILLNEGSLLFCGKPQALTQRVQGRAFLVSPPPHERRAVLNEILAHPSVMDGVIQGSKIRLLLRKNDSPHPQGDNIEDLEKTPARFEDAFIDILGGNKYRASELAQNMAKKTSLSAKIPIEAKDLTKCFGTFTAASHMNFTIQQGEIFGLLGPNGAGKSTTFKMLCGLLKPTSGQSLISGLDLKTSPSEARLRIGYMAQKFSLYGDLSVLQNLSFFSGVYGLRGRRQSEKIQQMIEIFDLAPLLNRNANVLPLGFKQRLALACSVMHEPDILFLDEPTSGVDPLTRREFWLHINQMAQKGMTIMVTTHFMDEAENCDRISLIYRGRSIAIGTPDALKKEASSSGNPSPTLEDAFIELVTRSELDHEMNGGIKK